MDDAVIHQTHDEQRFVCSTAVIHDDNKDGKLFLEFAVLAEHALQMQYIII